MSRIQRYRFGQGNAMVEYALPAGIFVLGVGILATTVNVNGLLGQFYAMANGDSASAIAGGRYSAKALGLTASGSQGNGAGNFNISGGSGGFGPGIAAGGGGGGMFGNGGLTSSGSSSADSTGGAGQDEVLAMLKNAKSPMDVYNAIKDTGMPDQFKGLVQAMAQQQVSMSVTTDSKSVSAQGNATNSTVADYNQYNQTSSSKDLADLSNGLNATTIGMLMYAANPASAADINRYGGAAAVALAKAFSDGSMETASKAWASSNATDLAKYADVLAANGIDTASIVNGTANVTTMAQTEILMRLGVLGDGAKTAKIMEMLKQNPPPSLATLQAIAGNLSDAEVAEIAALSDGTCAAAAVCVPERDKLLKEAKDALKAAQASIDATNQAAVDTAAAAAAPTTTP